MMVLQSCGPQPGAPGTVTVNGVRYANADSALAALQGTKNNVLAAVARESDPVKGTALVILPDHDRLRPLTAQQVTASMKQVPPASTVDFINSANAQNLHELADALVKNGTFETVTIEERNDVINLPTTGADYMIAFQVKTILPNNTGLWVGAWTVRRQGNAQALAAALDPGTPAGAPRLASFIKSVREDALRLGGTSVAGKTAADLPNQAGAAFASSGSGIVVDKQGGVLTNAHVVNVCVNPAVIDTSNQRFRARIVTKDEANDLALLRTDHHWPQPAVFADENEVIPGATAIVSGFPLAGVVASSMSVTAGTVSATAGPRDDSRLFQITAPVQPGNSGGPVLDAQGHVTGVVSSVLNNTPLAAFAGVSAPQNVNFAIKSAIVRNFLASQGVDVAHGSGGKDLPTPEVGGLARRFTVRVECGGPPGR